MVSVSLWSRLTRSRDETEAADLLREFREDRCSAMCECQPGDLVMLVGTVRSMTLRPREQAPALEVDLYDGSGSVTVIWLGRRRIPGVTPGRRMVVWGRLTNTAGVPRIFNPRYELKPAAA